MYSTVSQIGEQLHAGKAIHISQSRSRSPHSLVFRDFITSLLHSNGSFLQNIKFDVKSVNIFRPCLHVYGFVWIRFYCGYKLYASTRIRICCVFDRLQVSESYPKSISKCSNRLLSMRWWINWDDYHGISKRSGYKRQHVAGFVAFSKVSTLGSVFKSLHLQCKFSPDTYVWTKAITKFLRIQTNPDTCGQGLSYTETSQSHFVAKYNAYVSVGIAHYYHRWSQPDNLVPLCKCQIIIIVYFLTNWLFSESVNSTYLHSGTKSSGWLRYWLLHSEKLRANRQKT